MMLEILLILVIIFVIQLISNLIKVPFILFILLISALIGPNGYLNKTYNIKLLDENQIELLSQLGILLLLYLIGLQINIRDLITYNVKALGFFLFTNLSIALVLYLFLSNYFMIGVPKELIFVISIVLSFTSTAIYYELAKDYKLNTKPESKLLLSRSIIEDLVSIFILTFTYSVSDKNGFDITSHFYSFGISFILFVLASIIIYFVFVVIRNLINSYDNKNDENIKQIYFSFFVSIFVILILIAQLINFPLGIAAFIAGVISNIFSRELQMIKDSIFIFSETFVSIFLIYIGSQLDLSTLLDLNYWYIALSILIILVIVKFITSIYYYIKLGYNAKNSIAVTFLSISIGEFTLIILTELDKLFNFNLINIGFILLVLSVVTAIIMMNFSNGLIKLYEKFTGSRL